jgi:hypothetical protein
MHSLSIVEKGCLQSRYIATGVYVTVHYPHLLTAIRSRRSYLLVCGSQYCYSVSGSKQTSPTASFILQRTEDLAVSPVCRNIHKKSNLTMGEERAVRLVRTNLLSIKKLEIR